MTTQERRRNGWTVTLISELRYVEEKFMFRVPKRALRARFWSKICEDLDFVLGYGDLCNGVSGFAVWIPLTLTAMLVALRFF